MGARVLIPNLERPIATDPPVRADGKCYVCGKSRKITKQTRKYAKHAADVDPFCSGNCARRWYGVGCVSDRGGGNLT
jgi:hypothetical protein